MPQAVPSANIPCVGLRSGGVCALIGVNSINAKWTTGPVTRRPPAKAASHGDFDILPFSIAASRSLAILSQADACSSKARRSEGSLMRAAMSRH